MDALTMMILISVGNVVAWVAAMVQPGAERGLLVNVVACTAGAFAGGWLARSRFPEFDGFGLIGLGFAGALAALWLVRRLRAFRP